MRILNKGREDLLQELVGVFLMGTLFILVQNSGLFLMLLVLTLAADLAPRASP